MKCHLHGWQFVSDLPAVPGTGCSGGKGNKLPCTPTAGGIGNQRLKWQEEEIQISHREDAVAEDREYWEGAGFPLLGSLLPMNGMRQ